MQVGDLVKCRTYFGIVVGHWIHDTSEEEHTLVHWLTGRYTGETDAILESDLEIVCK